MAKKRNSNGLDHLQFGVNSILMLMSSIINWLIYLSFFRQLQYYQIPF